jgi:hypothetical protein
LEEIGVTTSVKTFTIKHENEMLEIEASPRLEVNNVKHAFRTGRENKQLEQIIITLTQTHHIRSGEYRGIKFRGGCTMVLSILNDNIKTEYIIRKRFDSDRRLSNQVSYQTGLTAMAMPLSSYDSGGKSFAINFEKLHIH